MKIEEKMDGELKNLVKLRLEVMPSRMKLSLGNEGSFTKDELIEHLTAEDEIGKTIYKIHLNFLQSLKEGKIREGEC